MKIRNCPDRNTANLTDLFFSVLQTAIQKKNFNLERLTVSFQVTISFLNFTVYAFVNLLTTKIVPILLVFTIKINPEENGMVSYYKCPPVVDF